MLRKPDNSPQIAAPTRSGLSALQPIDTSPFKRPSGLFFIWFTLILIWMISLLPWRLWQPAPDLLLLVVAFWCLNESQRVTMLTAFVFGLLMDVHDAALLRSEEHKSALPSLMSNSYAVFCLKKQTINTASIN